MNGVSDTSSLQSFIARRLHKKDPAARLKAQVEVADGRQRRRRHAQWKPDCDRFSSRASYRSLVSSSQSNNQTHDDTAQDALHPTTNWMGSEGRVVIEETARKTAKETEKQIRSQVVGEAMESLQMIPQRVEALMCEALKSTPHGSEFTVHDQLVTQEVHRLFYEDVPSPSDTTPEYLCQVNKDAMSFVEQLEPNDPAAPVAPVAVLDLRSELFPKLHFQNAEIANLRRTSTMRNLCKEISRIPQGVQDTSSDALCKMKTSFPSGLASVPEENMLNVAEVAGRAAQVKVDRVLSRINEINVHVQNSAIADAFVRAKIVNPYNSGKRHRSRRLAKNTTDGVLQKLTHSGLSGTAASSAVMAKDCSLKGDWTDAAEYLTHKKTQTLLKRMDRVYDRTRYKNVPWLPIVDTNSDEQNLYTGSMSKRKLGDHNAALDRIAENDAAEMHQHKAPHHYIPFFDCPEDNKDSAPEYGGGGCPGTPSAASTNEHNFNSMFQSMSFSGKSWADLTDDADDDDWFFNASVAKSKFSDNPASTVVAETERDIQSVLQAPSSSGESSESPRSLYVRRAYSEFDATAPKSIGSRGHPDFCCRACLYYWKGQCRHGNACPFCHLPHLKRPPRLDKRHRQILEKLPFNRLYGMISPVALEKCQKYTELNHAASRLLLLLKDLDHTEFVVTTAAAERDCRMQRVIMTMPLGHIIQLFNRLGCNKLKNEAHDTFAHTMKELSGLIARCTSVDEGEVSRRTSF